MPTLGLIGAPLLFSSSLGTLFGVNSPMSVWTGIATVPIFMWELSIGPYMTFKGYRPNAELLAGSPPDRYPAVRRPRPAPDRHAATPGHASTR